MPRRTCTLKLEDLWPELISVSVTTPASSTGQCTPSRTRRTETRKAPRLRHEAQGRDRANMHMFDGDTSNQSVFLLVRGRDLDPLRQRGFASSSTSRSTFTWFVTAGDALRDESRDTGSDTIRATWRGR